VLGVPSTPEVLPGLIGQQKYRMEDIAVIGLGLRFPGNATSPEKLWEVLEQGESQWSDIPKERINIEGYFHPSGDRQGSVSGSTFSRKCLMMLMNAVRYADPISRRSSSQGRCVSF